MMGIVTALLCGCLSNGGDWGPTGGENIPSFMPPRALRVKDRVSVTITVGHLYSERMEGVIDEHGKIPLPYLGPFKVIDMTPSDAANTIAKKYVSEDIFSGNVVVNVINLNDDDEYFIGGEVRSRGRVPLKPGITLRQAISAAGGVTEFASSKVTITRGGTLSKTFYLRRINSGRDQDPVILGGDIIEVQRTWL